MSASNTVWQQHPKEFNTVPLHQAGSKFCNSNAREGHHLWRAYHCGTAQAQPYSILCINITEEGTVAMMCLLKEATWTKVGFSCLQHAHLQRAAPSSEVLRWWMQHELLCLCSALQEQPIGLMSNQGQNSTPNICTETPDDISAETMAKGPVI